MARLAAFGFAGLKSRALGADRELMKALYFFYFFTFIYSPQAYSDLVTDFSLQIEHDKVNKILEQHLPEIISVKDSVFDLDEMVGLENMSFSEIKASLDLKTKIRVENSGLINAQFFSETVRLNLKNFDYLEYRYIDQGSIKAKVRVKVRCSTLPIQIKNLVGQAYAKASMKDSLINLKTVNKGFLASIGDITVDLKKCQAPKNIEPLFVEALRDWLESKEGQSLLYEEVIGFTIPYVDELVSENFKDIKILNESISLKNLSADFTDFGVSLKGKLSLLNYGRYRLEFSKDNDLRTNQNNSLVFPTGFLEKFVPIVFQSMKIPLSFSRENIPGIDLLFNRFVQTFVWGDLLKIKKNTNFVLDINLFDNKAAKLSVSDSALRYQISNRHWINMDFTAGTAVFPYMHFIGNTSSIIDLNFANDNVKLKLTDVRARTESYWNRKMNTWRKSKVGGKPVLSIVLPQAVKGLEGLEYDFSINELIKMNLVDNVRLLESRDFFGFRFD